MSEPELKLVLQEKSGQTWTSGITWVKVKEKFERVEFLERATSKLWDEIYALRSRVDILEGPQRKQSVINLLKGQKPHNIEWIKNRTRIFTSDIRDLVAAETLIETVRGTVRMYEVKV